MVAMLEQQSEIKEYSQEDFWQAVIERDASFDGVFVLGVRSTWIYCRPSCSSRKPKRENVVFFGLPLLAQQAGFRSCKRCLPDQHPSQDPQLVLVGNVCNLIAESQGQMPTLDELANSQNVSSNHLQRLFKRLAGISPRQYADALRLGTLKESLRNGMPVTDALYDAGYGSSSRLYEQSSEKLGMTPATYRNAGEKMQISYTVADCVLGKILIAATSRGICSVSLGETEGELEAFLVQEFNAAEISRDDQMLAGWLEVVLAHLNGNMPNMNLPLDIQATAFERLVWEQLQRIPYGETSSYSEIAEAIGRPKAARAVGNACGKNPVPILIPCHRVVKNDGGIGNYRYGSERKKKLLTQEKALSG